MNDSFTKWKFSFGMYFLLLISIFLLQWNEAHIVHAPYQVGIYLFDRYDPKYASRNFPICSAAIIHPLFCITTADCMHTHISASNVTPIAAKSIYLKSGNFSEIREYIKYVYFIHIHPEFNFKSMKNDIALIQLESSFRFEPKYNEHWIQMADSFTPHINCVLSINSPNVTQIYPFSQQRQTMVVNNSNCYSNRTNYLPEANNCSLCSFYYFDHTFMCQIDESQLKLNRDRGTPLICNNKLVGVLSVIIPSIVTNSTLYCSKTLQTYAYYTNVPLFDKWIHSVIAVNAPPHAVDGKPIPLIPVSPPYKSMNTSSKINNASIINVNYVLMAFLLGMVIVHVHNS